MNFHVQREFPGTFESQNLRGDNLSREIGRRFQRVCRGLQGAAAGPDTSGKGAAGPSCLFSRFLVCNTCLLCFKLSFSFNIYIYIYIYTHTHTYMIFLVCDTLFVRTLCLNSSHVLPTTTTSDENPTEVNIPKEHSCCCCCWYHGL